MSITAQDIQNEGFEHSLRGYDVEQVDVFLERVAQEVDAMNLTISQLNAQVSAAEGSAGADPQELKTANERADKAAAELKKAQKRAEEATARADAAEAKLKKAQKRAEEAEAKVEPLEAELAEKNEMDNTISQAFISAQRSADALKEEARAEGERIYREAEAKARAFIREALAKKAAIYQEIDALQKSADDFRSRYIAMVDDFSVEAKEKFADMEPPQIPDGIVNDMLPDIENINVNEGSEDEEEEAPAADKAPSAAARPAAKPSVKPQTEKSGKSPKVNPNAIPNI